MIKIKIHSFVDVITNSSTEMYIINQKKLTKSIEEIIDSLIFINEADPEIAEMFEVSQSNEEIGFDNIKVDISGENYYEDLYEDERSDEIIKKHKYYLDHKEEIDKVCNGLRAIFEMFDFRSY